MAFIIGTPYARNAGYYMNDDRVSGGQKSEADIKTCPHCQAIIKLSHDGGNFCGKCNAPVCDTCGSRMDLYGCEPFLKKLEREMQLGEKYLSFLKEAGLVTPVPPQPIFTGLQER